MSDNFFLHISSTQSLKKFPENQPTSFSVQLPRTIYLKPEGSWSVALVDIKLPVVKNKTADGFIAINLTNCQLSIVLNSLQPVLYRVFYSELSRGRHISPNILRYVPYISETLDTLQFHMKDSQNEKVSFGQGIVHCTLHFVKTVD